MSEARIMEIFDQMVDAYRGRLSMKPNLRAEATIEHLDQEMRLAVSGLKMEVARHVMDAPIREEKTKAIIGWHTCDCDACCAVGRSPEGPDTRKPKWQQILDGEASGSF